MRKYGCAAILALGCVLACWLVYVTYSIALAVGAAVVGAIGQVAVLFWFACLISAIVVAILGLAFLASPLDFAWTWLPILLKIWDSIDSAAAL